MDDWRNAGEERIEVPISAIEHFSYCPRQCAIIHLEQTFEDNVFTTRGHLAHNRVDEGTPSTVRRIRVARNVPLWSDRLGLQGKADVVEFRPGGPYPVEYKVGPRRGRHADAQLCAQALCLEEMLGVRVAAGAIYSHVTRTRHEVQIDSALRDHTVALVEQIRTLLAQQALPPPVADGRCPTCSLINVCLPWVVNDRSRARGLQGALFRPLQVSEEAPDA